MFLTQLSDWHNKQNWRSADGRRTLASIDQLWWSSVSSQWSKTACFQKGQELNGRKTGIREKNWSASERASERLLIGDILPWHISNHHPVSFLVFVGQHVILVGDYLVDIRRIWIEIVQLWPISINKHDSIKRNIRKHSHVPFFFFFFLGRAYM